MLERATKQGEWLLAVEERIVDADLPNRLGRQSTENGHEEIHDKKSLVICAAAIGNIGECRFEVDSD